VLGALFEARSLPSPAQVCRASPYELKSSQSTSDPGRKQSHRAVHLSGSSGVLSVNAAKSSIDRTVTLIGHGRHERGVALFGQDDVDDHVLPDRRVELKQTPRSLEVPVVGSLRVRSRTETVE
jgi:hypothetical protein